MRDFEAELEKLKTNARLHRVASEAIQTMAIGAIAWIVLSFSIATGIYWGFGWDNERARAELAEMEAEWLREEGLEDPDPRHEPSSMEDHYRNAWPLDLTPWAEAREVIPNE